MHVDDPRFPPLINGHGLKAPGRPFDVACRGVAMGKYAAADLLYARDTSRIDMALVLEPDVQRQRALEMLPLFELAVIEALGASMPPQTAVQLRWPDKLLVNGAVAGQFRFAAAPSAADQAPDWLVLAVVIALAPADDGREPGMSRDETTLAAEGAGELTRSDVLELISAYFLSRLDTWQESGLRGLHEDWVGRVEGYGDPAHVAAEAGGADRLVGRVLGLDDELNLLVKVRDNDVRALPITVVLEDKRPNASGAASP